MLPNHLIDQPKIKNGLQELMVVLDFLMMQKKVEEGPQPNPSTLQPKPTPP